MISEGTNTKAMLVVNPISGTRRKDPGLLERMCRQLEDSGFAIDMHFTTAAGDATTLARRAVAEGYDCVLACGGDGTINETATALCGTRVALGIIPSGSGNGLARHIGIPIDPLMSLDVLAQKHVVDCDYAAVNGDKPFFCTFGLGFDAAVSHRFARQKRRGKLSYIKSAIEEYVNYHPETYTIRLSDGTVLTETALIVAICNASQYGNNAYIAPQASITDGLLDITIVHAGNPFTNAVLGFDLMIGNINKNILIQTFRASGVSIWRPTPGEAHIDGEPVMLPQDIQVECHQKQLPIFTPCESQHFQPVLTPLRSAIRDWQIAFRHLFD